MDFKGLSTNKQDKTSCV